MTAVLLILSFVMFALGLVAAWLRAFDIATYCVAVAIYVRMAADDR